MPYATRTISGSIKADETALSGSGSMTFGSISGSICGFSGS